jgi:predicted transcriptional regulator
MSQMNLEFDSQKYSLEDTTRLTVDIVSSYVASNAVDASAISNLIIQVHQTLSELDGRSSTVAPVVQKQKPAVPVSRSLQQDHIVCLEDGQKLTMLKRYLRARYDLSPEDYRRKWGLPADYPMVAPAYASRRSEFAKSIGLGKGVRRKSA